jgi:enoyl-CoA hydratase
MTEVRLHVEGPVATLTLSAPERRNALTPAMARELVEACDAVDADPEIGAVVLCGEGDGFCAGGSRETLSRAAVDPVADAVYKDMLAVYESFARVGRLQPPTIAAVRGAAVGAGVNLMLATDLRVVAEDARILAGFLRIGVHPGGGHFTLVGRTAGREAAAALTLFGEELDGRRAVEVGLAWTALPASEVEAYAHDLARRAGRDPELARVTVRTMRLELGPPVVPWAAGLQLETASQLWSMRRIASDEDRPPAHRSFPQGDPRSP